MAYKAITAKNTVGTASFLSDLWTFLGDIGWTLHDNQDGSNYRVYKAGNDGTQAPVYTYIAFNGGYQYLGGGENDANKVYFTSYYYWDNSTQTAYGKAGLSATYIYTSSGSGWFYWMYGDPWGFRVISKVVSTYYFVSLEGIPNPVWGTNTTTTAQATAGSDVVIAVTDGTGFLQDRDYQVIGIAGEGREIVSVTDVTGNNITVSSLAYTHAAGAFIGETPCTFSQSSGITLYNFYVINPWTVSGTTGSNVSFVAGTIFGTIAMAAYYEPEDLSGRWFLGPLTAYESGFLGTFSPNIMLISDGADFTAEALIYPDVIDSGLSTGSNTTSTLNDTGKTWTINEHADKTVMIYGGTGYSSVRKITSNTATELTVTTLWSETPDDTSNYRIVDYAYRFFDIGSYGRAFLEGSDV